jgi:hypothetical protein
LQEDIIKDIKRHAFYLKPGQKKRVKQVLARKRDRKKNRRDDDPDRSEKPSPPRGNSWLEEPRVIRDRELALARISRSHQAEHRGLDIQHYRKPIDQR